MSEPKEKLDISDLKATFLECPVCVEHFNQTDRRPRLLHSCLHAFCTQCLHQLLQKESKGQITCPLCRQVQKVKGKADTLPADPVRGKLIEYVQIKQKQRILCSECEENDAIARCQECQSYLCKECDFVHRRHRFSKNHPIISLDEVLRQPAAKLSKGHFCTSHPKHHLEFYCATDEQLCCVSCTVLDHKGHELQRLDEAAATRRQKLETQMKEIYKLADLLREAREEGSRQKKSIVDTKLKSLLDIDDMFLKLMNALDDRKRQLVTAVHDNSNSLLSAVQKTSAAHDQTLAIIESTDTYFTQAKEKADIVEMLQMYPAIKRSVNGLKEPEPVSDFDTSVSDITFVKQMTNEMEVLVSSLGGFCQNGKEIQPEKPFTTSETEINPRYLKNQNWNSVKKQMKSEFKVVIEERGPKSYITGQFEDIFGEYTHLCKLEGFPAAEAQTSTERIRKRNGDSQIVSVDQLKAVQHLIGQEKFQECCDVEDTLQDQMKICFLDRGNEASSVQQRIQGVIQEEMKIIAGERDRAKDVASEAMMGYRDTYIKYQEDRNSMIMFAEGWDKMAKAKKRVALCFGRAKISSRGGRRFAGPKTAKADSPVNISFDKNIFCAKGRHINVKVYTGDITKLKVDVIVNAANKSLSHGAGVARAIADAAGPALTRESHDFNRRRGDIQVSHLGITSAGRLPYKMVFHAVGPVWYNYSDMKQCLEDLCHTILRCLCEAEQQDFASIAIPSISSDIFVPYEDCARMYIRALKSFDRFVNNGNLREVHFVDISNIKVSIIKRELKDSWHQPAKEGEEKRDADFIQNCLRPDGTLPQTQTFVMEEHAVLLDHGTKSAVSSLPQHGLNSTTNGFFKFSDSVSLNIFREDIFAIKTDALVSWEVEGLYADTPLINTLVRKGGHRYLSERLKYSSAKLGSIVRTSGWELFQHHVFHAVVGTNAGVEEFNKALKKMFRLCVKWNCSSVLLPVYFNMKSSGTGNTKSALFTEAVVDALIVLTQLESTPSLHAHIVDKQQNVVDNHCEVFKQYLMSEGLTHQTHRVQEEVAKKTRKGGEYNMCSIN